MNQIVDSGDEFSEKEKRLIRYFLNSEPGSDMGATTISGFHDMSLHEIEGILCDLAERGYFEKEGSNYRLARGNSYKQLCNFFRDYIRWRKISIFAKESWNFLWKHFVVTIATSVATAWLVSVLLTP